MVSSTFGRPREEASSIFCCGRKMCSACRQTKGAGTKRRHCHTRVADASRQLCDNADRLSASSSYRQWIQNKSMMMSATEKKSRVPMLMGEKMPISG